MNAEQISYYSNLISFLAIILLWFVFAGIFLLRKKPETTPDKTSIPKSWFGLILQSLSFALIWSFRRSPLFSPLFGEQYSVNLVLQISAPLIAAGSVWLVMSAVRELGKQWSLSARLLEDHKLIKTGVYQIVRHPIYTAMLGMLVATGIAYSHWIVLFGAIIVFVVGTKIRTNFEEGLLRDAFGREFTDWEAKVPGLIPFIKI